MMGAIPVELHEHYRCTCALITAHLTQIHFFVFRNLVSWD